MDKKKLVHELSVEDLLKSLENDEITSTEEDVIFTRQGPVLSFIQAFNILEGKYRVSDKVLYRLFKLWQKNSPIEIKTFNYQLANYIPCVQKVRKYYLVNQRVFDFCKKIEVYKEDRSWDHTKSLHWNKHFESFLNDNNLKPGPIFVEEDILYYVYNRWVDDTKRKSWLGEYTFNKICELNFECRTLAKDVSKWLGVNENIKKLITRKEVERWRSGKKKKNFKEDSDKEILYPKKRSRKVQIA